MMRKHSLIFVCLLSFLTACGGNGGSSPNTASDNTTGKQPGTPVFRQSSGSNYYVNLNSTAFQKHALSFNDKNNFRSIEVNGRKFDLSDLGINLNQTWVLSGGGISGGNTKIPDGITKAIVYQASQNVTVGLLGVQTPDSSRGHISDFAFFNGKFTDNAQIPKSGRANYTVQAAYYEQQQNSQLSSIISQNQTLRADFGAKTLVGTIQRDANSGGNIDIKANINGNRFESDKNAATQVKGGFFGKDAAEIGGAFQDSNTIGVFVGTKK